MRRLLLIAAACAAAHVGLEGSGRAQQRPTYAQPLSPPQARLLREQVRRLAEQVGIRDGTLRAIADALDASGAATDFPTLLRLVREKVEEAARLSEQLAGLQRVVARLPDGAERSLAEAALVRANAAFEEGRFDDTDRELANLEALRGLAQDEAVEAWVQSIEARAKLAELRLQYDRATEIRLAAAEVERIRSAHRQWRFLIGAAEAQDQAGRTFRDPARLRQALHLYRERALATAPRQEFPENWANTQISIGVTLNSLSDYENRAETLDLALASFRNALEIFTRERHPGQWGAVQLNMGVAYGALGGEFDRPGASEASLAAYQNALQIYTRAAHPREWVTVRNNMAIEILTAPGSGNRVPRIIEAIEILRTSLEVVTRDSNAVHWASIQANLSSALYQLGERQQGAEAFEEAAAAARAALSVFTRDTDPFSWAESQLDLGRAETRLGQGTDNFIHIDRAAAAYRAAAELYRLYDRQLDWARSSGLLAEAMANMLPRSRSCAKAREVEAMLADVRQAYSRAGASPELNFSLALYLVDAAIREYC